MRSLDVDVERASARRVHHVRRPTLDGCAEIPSWRQDGNVVTTGERSFLSGSTRFPVGADAVRRVAITSASGRCLSLNDRVSGRRSLRNCSPEPQARSGRDMVIYWPARVAFRRLCSARRVAPAAGSFSDYLRTVTALPASGDRADRTDHALPGPLSPRRNVASGCIGSAVRSSVVRTVSRRQPGRGI